MFLRSLLLAPILLLNATFSFGQNFTYKDWVWAYPNCDKPEFAKSWRGSPEGKLITYVMDGKELYVIPVISINSQTKYGAGSYLFKSNLQNYQEIYTFYTDNTAHLQERSTNGKLEVVNGVDLSNKNSTGYITGCSPNSYAAKLLVSEVARLTNVPSRNNSNSNNSLDLGGYVANECKTFESAKFQCRNAPDLKVCIKRVAPGLDLSASYLDNCALASSKLYQDAYKLMDKINADSSADFAANKHLLTIINGVIVADKFGCIDELALAGPAVSGFIQYNPNDPGVIKYNNLLKNPTCRK
jgi:hypothetical protein